MSRGTLPLGVPISADGGVAERDSRGRTRRVGRGQDREEGLDRLSHPRPPSSFPNAALFVPPSPREREIAVLLLQRCEDKEIAEKLGIGVGTVRTHLNRMREKSGRHDRLALGNWALNFPHS